jgi:hypothetical protein
MANTTNFNWETPDDTDLVKDGAAAMRTLGNSIDTTTKALNPSTTLGDIEYRSSTANTNTRLAIGTTGQVLAVVGGVPAWATTADQTPLTTKGDLFTFDTADARLAVGNNGETLVADSSQTTGLKWGYTTNLGLNMGNSADQSTNNTTETTLSWNTEFWDVGGYHSTSTNTSRITIPSGKGGKYLLNGFLVFPANATGARYIGFKKNGGSADFICSGDGNGTYSTYLNFSITIEAAAADYFEIVAFQNSGGALNVLALSRVTLSYSGA